MKCSKCGAEARDDFKFCASCGAQVQHVRFCTECGAECAPADKFCGKCGHKLGQETQAVSSQPQPHFAPPSPPTPSVFSHEDKTESIRKHVTVLVVDMKSSTEMISTMDPEEAKEILFPALQKLSSVVYEYGGIVISTAGDGLIAVFGAPQSLEDHALRACMTALSMHTQLKILNPNFVLRVGLNSGEIVLAMEGGKYDIVGSVVNLAARMEQTAEPGTIRMTQNTFNLASESVSVKSLGTLEIKGFAETISVFELKGVKVSRSLTEMASQFTRGTHFVNREQESAKAGTFLAAAKSGRGNALGLCAEMGFGKSRITYEIVKSDAAKECNILLTAAFIHTKEIPLLPINHLFRSLLGISSAEGDLEKIKSLAAPLLTKIPTPHALQAVLGLIGLNPSDLDWSLLEPGLKRKYMFEAGAKILINSSLQQPLIMIFEDLHWVDSETELFLDSLLSQIAQSRIFLMLNYRPEYRDHWVNKPNYTRMVLEPLAKEAGSQMLNNLLGNDSSLDEIKGRILATVEGNPFYLEELVSSLVEDKILVGEPQRYRLREGTSVKELHLPETIVTILQTKIDKLSPVEKKILQYGSVIGSKFVYSLLSQLIDAIDESEIRAGLNKLSESQYIYESQLYPEPGFTFSHGLTREIAYNSLLKKTRKSLHGKLFEILEKTLQEDQIDQLQIVAEHAFLSENWSQAFDYCTKAAAKVYEISAFSACAKLYERALVAAEHLPQADALVSKILRVHYELYYSYVPLGLFKEQYDHLQKALEIALSKKDRFYESIIHSAFAIHYAGYKDVSESLTHALNALEIAKEIKSLDASVIAQFTLVHIYLFMAKFKELFAVQKDLEELTANNPDFRTEWLKAPIGHITRCYESWGRIMTGDFPYVEIQRKAWIDEPKNLDQPSIPNMCRSGALAMMLMERGEFEKAASPMSTALQHSLSTEVFIFVPIFFASLGTLNLFLSRKDEAKDQLAQALAIVDKIHASFTTVFSFPRIVEGLLLEGEAAQAKEFCEKAIAIVKERKIPGVHAILLRLSGEIDLALPNPNFAEIQQKLTEALNKASEFGMIPYVGYAHLALARLQNKMASPDKSKEELKQARDCFGKLGMKYWAERSI